MSSAVKVMKFRGQDVRAFYRVTILPAHIEYREGEPKKALVDELAEWVEYIKEHGLEVKLAAFQAARDLRQSTYDAMELAKSVNEQEGSEANGTKYARALAAFEKAKGAYDKAYA